jgi:endonuclease YncB( thermonuclease family)
MRRKILIPALALTAIASAACADPCKAIPDHGPAPGYLHPGANFSGEVVYIGDGDSLCVAVGAGPSQWVEVRLADFYAPELHDPGGEQAKATLSRLAYGRQAACVADHQSYDRMVATCRIDGRSVGEMMRAAGVQEGGRAYPSGKSGAGGRAPVIAMRAAPPAPAAATGPYRNCAAARAAGAAPLYRGDPGYSPRLDRDNDGVACEPYRGR